MNHAVADYEKMDADGDACADLGCSLLQNMLGYSTDSGDSGEDEQGAASAAAAAAATIAECSTVSAVLCQTEAATIARDSNRFLQSTIPHQILVDVSTPPTHSLAGGPATAAASAAAGFVTSASRRLATAAARSLRVAKTSSSSSSSKKAKLFSKQAPLYSSTGLPTALKLMASALETPDQARAAIQGAVAAAATAMGYSIDHEVSKLKVPPPAGAVMDSYADVDPMTHPTAWRLLKIVNNEQMVLTGQRSIRRVMGAVQEVGSLLGEGPPQITAEQVEQPAARPLAAAATFRDGGALSDQHQAARGTTATPAGLPAAAAVDGASATPYSSNIDSRRSNAPTFAATVSITFQKHVIFKATATGAPTKQEAKRAAAAAVLEQILTDIPGLAIRRYICQLNPRVADLIKQQQQNHNQCDIEAMARNVMLLDPNSSVGREQRQRLQQEQERLRQKAESERLKREARIAQERVGSCCDGRSWLPGDIAHSSNEGEFLGNALSPVLMNVPTDLQGLGVQNDYLIG